MEFINAGLVGLAVFAAVPVIIHLLHKPRPKVQPFPSVMFLKKCARRSRAFAALKNIVLMALRCAAVILIAFAVARPRLAGAAQVGNGGFAAALVIDDSYRMSARDSGISRFEDARRRAMDVLATLPGGTEASLVFASGEMTPLTADVAALRAEVLRATSSDLAAPLLASVLEGARSLEGAKGRRREVHVFTDLAKAAWTGSTTDAVKALKDATIYVHDVGKDAPVNAAVTKVELSPRTPRAGRPVEITATVAAWGRTGAATVSLRVGDVPVEEKVVAVPDGGTAVARFRHTPESSEPFHGTVTLTTPDPLAIDDARHFAVAVNEPLKILVVEGAPDADRGIAPFLSYALAPPSMRERRPTRTTALLPAELPKCDLKEFEAVLVACPSDLAASDIHRLAAFAQSGGGVGIFADGMDLARLVTAGLFPSSEGSADAPAHLVPGTADHPLFAVFRAGRNGDMAAPTFSRRIAARKDARWKPAILFDDGRPAALEASAGRGRVLAFPFALAGSWTDLPKFPCFVPIAHEIARHLAGNVGAERDFTAGSPVFLPLAKPPTELAYALVDLKGGSRESRRADPALTSLHVARALPPGRFVVEVGGTRRPFAVNIECTGSDPTRATRDDVKKLLPGAQVSFAFERGAGGAIRDARTGRELTLFVLLATAALLLGELWLASRV